MIVVYPSVLDEMYARVARGLREADPDLRFTAVVTGAASRRRVQAVMPWERILVHTDYRRAAREPDVDLLKRTEQEWADGSLTWYAGADRVVWRFGHDRYLRDVTAAVRLAREAMVGATAIIAEGVDDLPSYLLYVGARHAGIPFITVQNTRFPGRVVLHTDYPRDRFERVEAIHERLRVWGMTAEQRMRAAAFVAEFREKALRPHIVSAYRPPRIDRGAVAQFVRSARGWLADPWDNSTLHPADLLARRLGRVVRGPIADAFLFDDPHPGERFVLFPLHFQPEASTLVRGEPYVDQLALIETLAKAIPIDQRLYVKEHMYSIGRRTLAYYRRLRAVPNVRLIHPQADSHGLIKAASMVATITGTMGWEAALYGTRVLLFGYAFYGRIAGVHQVTDLRRLPQSVAEVLSAAPPDEEDLLRLVAALFEGTYEGQIGHPDEVPEALTQRNIERLTNAVRAELSTAAR